MKLEIKHILISAIVIVFLIPLGTVSAHALTDVSGTYYENAINYLMDEGVVQGYPDGTFGPQKNINRAELIKIILEAAKVDVSGASNKCFSDVMGSEWYVKYVCKAKELHVVDGYADGTFKPSQNVNFVEALKITMLGYGLHMGPATDPWYKQYVDEAAANNIIPLTIDSFSQDLKRGEMADMITRFNKKKDGNQSAYLAESFGEDGDIVLDYDSIEYNAEGDDDIDGLIKEIDNIISDIDSEEDFSDFSVNE